MCASKGGFDFAFKFTYFDLAFGFCVSHSVVYKALAS